MALEQRGTNTYYYRKRWIDGTCQSEYVGRGAFAHLLAGIDALERLAARQEAAEFHALREELTAQAALVLGAEADTRDLAHAVLIANGFHQHKRQWRRSSMDTPQPIVSATNTPPATVDDDALLVEARAALKAALKLPDMTTGKRGKALEWAKHEAQEARRTAVRKVLQEYPVLWSGARGMFTTAESVMIKSLTTDGLTQEFIEFALKGIRRDLGYESAPVLEKLLIAQVALAWLDLEAVQKRYAAASMGSHNISSGVYWDKRVTGAQGRYLRAVEALARVRRLATPQPLQVNIGGQQVNVAGPPVNGTSSTED